MIKCEKLRERRRRREKVGEGWRRLEKVGGGWRRLEEVGESLRKLEKQSTLCSSEHKVQFFLGSRVIEEPDEWRGQ